MATKTFNIDGRDCEVYQLKNRDLVDLIKSDTITEEDRKLLTDKLIERFEYDNCPHHAGEDEKNVFVRQFSDFVNGKCHGEKKKVAELMAQDHRYLQSEMFKICLEYIKILAENHNNGYFDPRNEWACTASHYMIEGLKNADYPY
jgi:hypothetical protein